MLTTRIETLGLENKQVVQLLGAIGESGFIGGGMARHIAFNHQLDVPVPSDIDIFPCTDAEWGTILAPLGYTVGNTLFNCVEYKHPYYTYKVQLVNPHANEYIKMWGSINNVLANFDFTINQVGLQGNYFGEYTVVRGNTTLDDLATKTLRIAHMNNPVAMSARVIKYSKLGYTISLSELAKIFIAWGERPEEYRAEITALVQDDNRDAATSHHLYTLLRTT